jgi:chromosome segregation ATPase
VGIILVLMPQVVHPEKECRMSQEMSFAQALNEARGVIVQLSNRVKSDAERIRSQQARIAELEAALAQRDTQADALRGQVQAAEGARDQAEGIINRQGERVRSLEGAVAALEQQIQQVRGERDEIQARLPGEEDAAALASMAALLSKAAPMIEKARRSNSTMRIAGSDDAQPIAEAA